MENKTAKEILYKWTDINPNDVRCNELVLAMQEYSDQESDRLRSALLEIANMRGSVASDIAIKALNQ